MQHIARAAFLVLLILPLEAKPFGSQAVGPAPGYRSVAKLASGAAGTIAVWRDTRNNEGHLYAAILNSDGGPTVVHKLDRNPNWWDGFFVGADDAGFLIISSNDSGYFARRIAADGTVMPAVKISFPGNVITALAGSGKVYAATVGSGTVLLDRDGRVISGALLLSSYPARPIASGSRFLLSSTQSVAIVSENDFPPPGQIRNVQPLWRQPTMFTAAPAPPGWVIAERALNRLRVQRLSVRGLPLGPALHYEVTDDPSSFYSSVSVAAHGDEIVVQYVANSGKIEYVHFDAAGRARKIEAPGPDRQYGALNGTKNGVMAAWITRDWVLSAGRVSSPVWDDGGALLAFSRRAQAAAVLASGGGVILAAWNETSGRTTQAFVAVLAPDGELRSAPVVLPPDSSPAGIAFGSGKYLLVFRRSPRTYHAFGQFVGTDGAFLGEPFRIFEDYDYLTISAVASDGIDFYAASEVGVQRIRADGTVVNAEPYVEGGRPHLEMSLAWDGERLHSIYRRTVVHCQPCGAWVKLGSELLSRDLQPLRSAETLAETGVRTVGPNPVIAASNGKALALWNLDSTGLSRLWHTTVTNKDGVVVTHEHKGFHRSDLVRRPQIVAHGNGFVATIDPALLRFDENGELVAWTIIDPLAQGSALVSTGDRVLVLYERMEDVRRLHAVSLPLPEAKRRAAR